MSNSNSNSNRSQDRDETVLCRVNEADAMAYLKSVKDAFPDGLAVYEQFLDTLKEFMARRTDTLGVMTRVAALFHDHPALVRGFTPYLPSGYRMDVSADGAITTVTPDDLDDAPHASTSAGVGHWHSAQEP